MSIGLTVAALAGTKAVEKIGAGVGETGWGLAERLVGRVRGWLAENDDVTSNALAELEAAPTSEGQRVVAVGIDSLIRVESTIGRELSKLVDLICSDPLLAPVVETMRPTADRRSGNVSLGGGARVDGPIVTNPSVGGDFTVS